MLVSQLARTRRWTLSNWLLLKISFYTACPNSYLEHTVYCKPSIIYGQFICLQINWVTDQKDRAVSPQSQFGFTRLCARNCRNTAVALPMPTWIQVQLSHFYTRQTSTSKLSWTQAGCLSSLLHILVTPLPLTHSTKTLKPLYLRWAQVHPGLFPPP